MDGGTGLGAELLSPAEAEWPPELRLPPPPPTRQPKEIPAPAPPSVPHFLGSIMAPAAAQPQPQQTAAAAEVPVKRKRGRPRKNPPPPTQQPKENPAPAPAPPVPPPQLQKKEPSPLRPAEGFDDQRFRGSITGSATAQPQSQPQPQSHQPATAAAAEAPVKRKPGRPRKNPEGAPPPPKPPPKTKDEEFVCFICFDGGNLVLCDRRCCPKAYHPACVKRDESFFRGRGKWDCGWHICSICEKAAQYMCFTCTYSLCKGCIGQGSFFGVRGNKGFCDTCYATISLIESKDEGASKIRVDFDDKSSWEYLFKLYWLYQKGKHLLTLEELIGAKSRWTVPTNVHRRAKEEESDESYDASNDEPDASFDISSRKRRRNNSSGKTGRKRQNVTPRKPEISVNSFESLPNRIPIEGMVSQGDTTWASAELLEFIGHMRNGVSSYISKYDVHLLLLEYIKQNNLRDPRKKSQIICDARLSNLFRKPRVARFEMLNLLEMHFHVKDNPAAKADSHQDSAKLGSDKRKVHKKIDSELPANQDDYAAIDMHNINLIYLRRSLMEDLIDDKATFSDKIAGAFVRIRVSGLGQKQDMYRLVRVLGTHKVTERYSVGKKTTDYALEILNLDKKELITMDTISNQDFTEEECKRLRQSMKFGLVAQLKVGDIYEKAKIFRSLQCDDWLENEKQRLCHLRDRASENGRRKELRECVEKLQLLNTPEERARRINEVPEVHVDPRMAPDYRSAEEQNFKRAADWTINRSESDLFFPERKGTQSMEHRQKSLDARGHMSGLPMEDMTHRSGADMSLNNTSVESASFLSSGAILSDTEPENVWHYRDPSGTVQGPFTLLQLSNWAPHFPSDLRIWLTFESEKNSLLLTEVLKQQKYFVIPSAVTAGDKSIGTGTGQDRTKSGLVANNSSSCIGHNAVHSYGLSCHSAEFSDPKKEGSTDFCGTSPSRSPKDAHNIHGLVQHQVNYSCTIPSLTTPDSHDLRVSSVHVDKLENCQDIDGTIHTFKSHIEGHPHPHSDEYTLKDQLQNDSKGILSSGSVENFSFRIDSELQKVSVFTLQQSHTDPAASFHTRSPLEFICKEEDTCWRASANASTRDDLHLSISLANQETCSPTNAVEDRDSSSASGVPNRIGASACHPQLQYISVTNSSNILSRQNTSLTDASSKPLDQHSELNCDPAFSSDTHQDECEYPSPTPKLERKQTSMNQSGPLSVISKDSGTKTCDSSISILSESCGPPAGKTCNLQLLNQTSCPEERHSSYTDITAQKGQLNEGITAVNLLGAKFLGNFMSTSTEEQPPQCSSPIALSPWGEQNYYQDDAVDSALWGVQDDHSNDMWSMHSPTPALQASSGLRADGKDASSIIEEMMAARESSDCVETLLKQGDKKMDQGNSSAPRGSGALKEVKTKPSSVSAPPSDGTTKAADFQSSVTALEGNAEASRWNPPGLLLEEFTKASDWQRSDISKESWQPSDSSLGEGAKASGWQRSSSFPDWSRKNSKEGSAKASDQQQSSVSPEGSRKASGCQRSDSSVLGNTKASGWQPSGSSAERSVKADDWQRTSSSPERSRKGSGWNWSLRESSRANSTSGANENHKSSTSSKNLWEAPMRQGNRIEKTVSWREALGSAERRVKADGWQRTSSSPEKSRKSSGWHQSFRESSRANSTSGVNENYKSSSQQATTTSSNNPCEAPLREGNTTEKTISWGGALGNNRSWIPSSGNASWGSQGVHNRDRHSQDRGRHSHDPDRHSHDRDRHSHRGDSRQGHSNYCRRADNRQEHDHHQDHDRGGSSRWLSRGQLQRGVCKYYQRGNCFKGNKCQYEHR